MEITSKIPLVALIAVLTGSSMSHAKVEKKHDRFKNKTAVVLEHEFGQGAGHSRPRIVMIGAFDGDRPAAPPKDGFLFSISFVNDEWEYMKCSSVSMLIDGRPIQPPDLDHDGDVGRGYVIERLRAPSPLSFARAIASAQSKIEMKVCTDEFVLPLTLAAEVKQFLNLLGDVPTNQPLSASQVAESDLLNPIELERALQIIRCNVEKADGKTPTSTVGQVCGGIFKDGKLTLAP